MQLVNKDLLDMGSLSATSIKLILDTAMSMREINQRTAKKVPTLRGKTIALFFYEPSTRTKLSFEIAAKRLSADAVSLTASTSSMQKGETLIDTARNIEAMSVDAVIIRHSASGAPYLLAKSIKSSVINAGDGMHAHPSQALLDLLTVTTHKKKIEGLRIAIVGDIAHSRVARSNIIGFKKMGAEIVICGPRTMIPKGIEKFGCALTYNLNHALEDADVVMMLRIQKERTKIGLLPSEREYAREYGLTTTRLQRAKKNVLIMHPGPVNRGVEISPDVVDGPFSVILDQVANGVAVRMAILYLLAGGKRDVD